jgi:hypothetical protein
MPVNTRVIVCVHAHIFCSRFSVHSYLHLHERSGGVQLLDRLSPALPQLPEDRRSPPRLSPLLRQRGEHPKGDALPRKGPDPVAHKRRAALQQRRALRDGRGPPSGDLPEYVSQGHAALAAKAQEPKESSLAQFVLSSRHTDIGGRGAGNHTSGTQ